MNIKFDSFDVRANFKNRQSQSDIVLEHYRFLLENSCNFDCTEQRYWNKMQYFVCTDEHTCGWGFPWTPSEEDTAGPGLATHPPRSKDSQTKQAPGRKVVPVHLNMGRAPVPGAGDPEHNRGPDRPLANPPKGTQRVLHGPSRLSVLLEHFPPGVHSPQSFWGHPTVLAPHCVPHIIKYSFGLDTFRRPHRSYLLNLNWNLHMHHHIWEGRQHFASQKSIKTRTDSKR